MDLHTEVLLAYNAGEQARADIVNGRICSWHWSHDCRHIWHELEVNARGQHHWFLGHYCSHCPRLLLDICCLVQVHVPPSYSLIRLDSFANVHASVNTDGKHFYKLTLQSVGVAQ